MPIEVKRVELMESYLMSQRMICLLLLYTSLLMSALHLALFQPGGVRV